MILEECQFGNIKRETINHEGIAEVDVERTLYIKLLKILTRCREKRFYTHQYSTTKEQTASTSQVLTTTSSVVTNATTTLPQPIECDSAVNLTEYWRQIHNGTSVQGISNCDTSEMKSKGRPWFRFSEAAGNMMLDTCPPAYSCGTHAGMWTDDAMPTNVGIQKNINAYGSFTKGCKSYIQSISVIRCSSKAADFVYKYTDPTAYCKLSFCGMTRIN